MTNEAAHQKALNILSAWEVLEILSPQKYQSDEEGDSKKIRFQLMVGALPWENGRDRAKPGYRIFFYNRPLSKLAAVREFEGELERSVLLGT